MRLLQLITGEDELLDLHPNVTVVRKLDGPRRALLVDALRALARGTTSGSAGLLEAHGVLFDLDPELVALLEVALDDPDPVVGPGDLPNHPLTVDGQELAAREQAFAALLERIAVQVERQAEARAAVAECTSALDAARAARARAERGAGDRREGFQEQEAELERLQEERERLERELTALTDDSARAAERRAEREAQLAEHWSTAERAMDEHTTLTAELADVASARDVGAATAHAAARATVDALQGQAAADGGGPAAVTDGAGSDDPAERVSAIDARLRTIDQLLTMLGPHDGTSVAEALALHRGDGPEVELVPSTEAAVLADDLEAIEVELEEHGGAEEGGETAAPPDLAVVHARLEDARAAVLEAERAARSPRLDPADVAALEAAHDALRDAIDRSERRFGAGRARGQIDELRAAEQEILDRMGFSSYPDYVMGHTSAGVEATTRLTLDVARRELSEAEQAWERADHTAQVALARAQLLDRRRTMVERARALVGDEAAVGAELVASLRSLRVPAVSRVDAARQLQAALAAVGVDVGDEDLDELDLELFAEAWLSESDDVGARRQALVDEQASLTVERAALAALAPDTAGPAAGPSHADPAAGERDHGHEERLAAAEAVLEAAAQVLADHEAAEARCEQLAARIAEAEGAAQAAMERASAAEATLLAAIEEEQRVGALRQAVEEELTAAQEATEAARFALEALGDVEEVDIDSLNAAIDVAEAAHRDAVTALDVEGRALAALDAEGQAAAIEIERLQDIVAAQGRGEASPAEEVEWYLLARVASQRNVSVAGSLPLLLDDALRGLTGPDIDHVLGRLERMAQAVQIIVVSDDPLVAAWAEEAGPTRAAVVEPSAP